MGLTNNLGKLSNMITSTGSAVGIGTSSPVSLLNLSASTPTLTITDSAATGNGGNTYISSIKNGVGYNNLTFTAYSYTFLGGGSASTFLTINTAGAATFSSSVTVNGDSSIFNGGTANNFNTYALGIANTKYLVFASTAASQAGGRNWSGGIGADSSENIFLGSYNNLTFGAGTLATRMTILGSNGNVGIGTSTPNGKLNISNGGAEGIEFWVQSATATNLMQSYNRSTSAWNSLEYKALDHIFYGSGTERMRITSAGNVGIGTSSPSYKLDTYGTSGTTSLRVRDGNLSATAQILLECANTFSGISQAFISGVGTNGGNNSIDLRFGTSSGGGSATEKMRIASDGNVLVGGTSAIGKLSVIDNSAKTVSDIPLGLGSNTAVASQMQLLFYRNINLYFNIQAIEQGTAYRSIYLNLDGGAVYAGTQRIDNNSDARVKENIQPVTNALDTILSLNGKKFNMIDEDNILRYGFIAQEVQPILNDFVTESARNYKDGNNVIENLLTLETSGAAWAALLVEAIKEQQQQIEELKLKIK